jgi:hypothetical protein
VIDARVLAHTVVERLPLGYNADRGGAEAMMDPMVDGAIEGGIRGSDYGQSQFLPGLRLSMVRGGRRLQPWYKEGKDGTYLSIGSLLVSAAFWASACILIVR